jgi:hypothetical protein
VELEYGCDLTGNELMAPYRFGLAVSAFQVAEAEKGSAYLFSKKTFIRKYS